MEKFGKMVTGEQDDGVYEVEDLLISAPRRSLIRCGERIDLTPRVFDLLLMLVKNAGEIVTKDELLETVWADAVVEEGNVSRTVSTLRRKLGRDASGRDFIETVPKHGYRFIAPVRRRPEIKSTIDTPTEVTIPVGSRHTGLTLIFAGAFAIGLVALIAAIIIANRSAASTNTPTKNVLSRLTISKEPEMIPTYAADGRIRFARVIEGTSTSYVMNEDGTAAEPESSIAGLQVGLWSPDGKKVLFRRQGAAGVFLANADGSDDVKLPFDAGNSAWSSDSRRIVFQARAIGADGRQNFDIFVYTVETGAVDNLVRHDAFDGDPSFSPDGESILFVSDRDGNIEIYRKHLTDETITRLTENPGHDSYPSFSPDGTLIVFNSDREGENTDVYAMRPDGTGVRKITDLPSTESVGSSPWSPDGTKLLVVSNGGGSENIYAMDFDPFVVNPISGTTGPAFEADVSGNGSIVYFSGNPATGGALRLLESGYRSDRKIADISKGTGQPSFSPDGTMIAFTDYVGGNTEVFTMKVDGSERKNVTADPAADQMPSWSPDGRRIVFSSNRGGDLQRFEVWTVNLDGKEPKVLYRDAGSSVDPVFANDERLLFSNDLPNGRTGNFEIFSLDLASKTLTRATSRKRYDVAPAVSPDGSHIAFVSNSDGNSEIYLMRSDGSDLIRLTREKGDDIAPTWSADGSKIVFSSNRNGEYLLYEVAVPFR